MRFRGSWVAALVGAALIAAAAQEPQRPPFRDDATYVRVDLYATQTTQPVEDLRIDEIELLEDGVPQKLEAFEPVRIEPAGQPQRRRSLLLFMDTFHVGGDDLPHLRKPLLEFMTVVADRDLVALAHPRAARSSTLVPKAAAVSRLLDDSWRWGSPARDTPLDSIEQQWFACYGAGDRFEEMRARRRGGLSLDALFELVTHLSGIAEERKAVLLVSEGWQLFTRRDRRLPGFRGSSRASEAQGRCEAERAELMSVDTSRRARELAGEANRARVSFYAIHPLALLKSPETRDAGETGSSRLRQTPNFGSLRELAAATDGVAVANPGELDTAKRRIAADLTSYYLLTYRPANANADGRFRSWTIRVKRPGVAVRARPGYRALTFEQAAARRSAAAASAASAARAAVVSGILHRPDDLVNPVNLASLRHAVLWKRGPTTGREYVASEEATLRRSDFLRLEHATTEVGATSARLIDAAGKPMKVPVQVSERPDPSGDYRWVIADLALAPFAPGEYAIELTIGDLKVQTPFQIVP